MGKRAPVQGWPFALVHACAANAHQIPATTLTLPKQIFSATQAAGMQGYSKKRIEFSQVHSHLRVAIDCRSIMTAGGEFSIIHSKKF